MNYLFSQWDKLSANYKGGLLGLLIGAGLTAIVFFLICR